MTIQNKDSARRVPGPLGSLPEGVGGRVPGPFGRPLWDKQSNSPEPSPTAKTVKTTTMPLPAKDQVSKNVHEVLWPLYKSKGTPTLEDVKQSPQLANCPVAAILAAHAFTSVGRSFIQELVSPTVAVDSVLTDLSHLPPDTLTDPPSGSTIRSSRYFTVKLPGGSIDVSDVLYTDTGDSGWSLRYMQDPQDASIWAAIIEKALAVQFGSYENFDDLNISANDFWKKISGVMPGGVAIHKHTTLSKITDAAKASLRVPTMCASNDDSKDVSSVTPFHGYAMMGMKGNKIQLYDPANVKKMLLTPEEFRHDFQAILLRK